MIISIIRYSCFLWSIYKLIINENNENINNVKNNAIKCGPLAIKLLQYILSRDNIIKTKKLNFVLEDCMVHSFKETNFIYLQEFGKLITEDFIIKPDTLPVGSGSIGQVYKIRSIKLNKFVAVKIKHPGVDTDIKNFTRAIKVILFLFGRFIPFKYTIVEFIENIQLQLDYHKEASNYKCLYNNFSDEDTFIIPEIYSFSDSVIIMSYHEGSHYDTLTKQQQLIVSMYLNFFELTSCLIHDLLHGDLHKGNFKVLVLPSNEIKIIIYDCGLMCTTNDLSFNKEFFKYIFNNDYTSLIKLISNNESMDKIKKCTIEINKLSYFSSENRLKLIISKVMQHGLFKNLDSIHLLNAIGIFSDIQGISVNKFTRYTCKDDPTNAIIFYNYIEFLKKMNKFHQLTHFLEDWVNEDLNNKSIYYNWLDTEFGHTRGDIIADILYSSFMECT